MLIRPGRRVAAEAGGADLGGQRRVADGRAQRRLQPRLGELQRVDAVRQVAQLGLRLAQVGRELREHGRRLRGVGVHQPLGDPRLHGRRDEPLLGAVVQVALDPAALAVGRGRAW
nr:hypothetical protein [Nonomuraea gerenzanensis]